MERSPIKDVEISEHNSKAVGAFANSLAVFSYT